MAGYEEVLAQLASSLASVALNLVNGAIEVLIVILFLLLGYYVAKIVEKAVVMAAEKSGVEKWVKDHGLQDALAGFTLTGLSVMLVKLVVIAAFLGIAADVTNIGFLRGLVTGFIGYVPLLLQGIVVIVLAMLAIDYVSDRIEASKNVPFAKTIAVVAKAFVAYTALVIALPLVLPSADTELLRVAFYLLVGSLALSLGLGMAIAIGLGLKDTVADLAKKRKADIEKII